MNKLPLASTATEYGTIELGGGRCDAVAVVATGVEDSRDNADHGRRSDLSDHTRSIVSDVQVVDGVGRHLQKEAEVRVRGEG
jgi:hypothetical protein